MKKIILLIILMLGLSGCSANYDLVYENGNFYESIDIIDKKGTIIEGEIFEDKINNYYNNNYDLVNYKIQPGDMSDEEIVKEYDIYKKSIINKDDIYGINLSFGYNSGMDYQNSSLRYSFFENMLITNEYISAGEIKNIFNIYNNLDEITITFKTDKYVNYSNADYVENGKYIWNFTKSNFMGKNIKIEFSDKDNRDFVEKLKDKTYNVEDSQYDKIINYFFIILGVILLSIIVFVSVKVKNSNKK